MRRSPLIATLLLAAAAHAGQIETQAELEALLDDALYQEDFEGFSVHGGTGVTAPNPLNSDTAPATWDLLPGVTYASTTMIRIYGGFLHGDDSNIVQAGPSFTVTFAQPQLAVGFDLVYNNHDVATFYHGSIPLGTLDFTITGGFQFAAWQDPSGITSVHITSNGLGGLDNVFWGIDVAPPDCPGDANGDLVVDFDDLNLVLAGWGSGPGPGDVNHDGFTDFDDLNLVLANWSTNCLP